MGKSTSPLLSCWLMGVELNERFHCIDCGDCIEPLRFLLLWPSPVYIYSHLLTVEILLMNLGVRQVVVARFDLHPNLLPFRYCRHRLQTTSYRRGHYPRLNKCDSRIGYRLMAVASLLLVFSTSPGCGPTQTKLFSVAFFPSRSGIWSPC